LFIDPSASLKSQINSLLLESGTNRYSTTFNDFAVQYEFRFIDINKKEFLNIIPGGSRISLPATLLDTVVTSTPLKISWTEAAVGSSENVTIRIAAKNFVQDTLNAKSISIPSSELALWKGSAQKVYIERLNSIPLQQKIGSSGSGSISNRYISQSRTIYFK
jgi:hypothetical protein